GLADDQPRAACGAAPHVLDHARGRRAVIHEAALHAGHHKTITQDEVADLQRCKQGIEQAQIPSSTLAIYWKTKQKTWPVRARFRWPACSAQVPPRRAASRPFTSGR